MTLVKHYALNHPKTYLGYALALKRADSRAEADDLVAEKVVAAPDMARQGAEHLSLVIVDDDHAVLTERGRELTAKAVPALDATTTAEALDELETLKGARKRFVAEYPALADIGLDIADGDSALGILIRRLNKLMEALHTPTLYGIIDAEWELNRKFITALFIRDHDVVREEVLGGPMLRTHWPTCVDELDHNALSSGVIEHDDEYLTVYRSATTYQLKNLLWHLGILTEKGTQARNLTPTEEVWALEPWVQDPSLDAPSRIDVESESEA